MLFRSDQSQTELLQASILDNNEITMIENAIDKIDEILPIQTSFILPGGTRAAAHAHICRTVCRRAERRILSLGETVEVSSDVLAYMNRISDYLYILSRKLNFISNRDEKIWQKTCK